MTKELIYEKRWEIHGKLSDDAKKASMLYTDYHSALREWKKDSQNFSNQLQLDLAAKELEKFCKEHRHIRAEIQNAKAKIEKILRDDENDPEELKSESKQKIAQLKAQIKELEKPKKADTKTSGVREFVSGVAIGLPLVCGAVSLVGGLVCHIINAFLANEVLQNITNILGGTCSVCVVLVILMAVCSGSNEKQISQLKDQLSTLEKNEKWYDDDRRYFAVSAREEYDLILNLIGGARIDSIIYG